MNETGFPGLYTQKEHTANWFYTKRSNGLGDMPFTSQTIYTASELVLFKEINSLLKECATQTNDIDNIDKYDNTLRGSFVFLLFHA